MTAPNLLQLLAAQQEQAQQEQAQQEQAPQTEMGGGGFLSPDASPFGSMLAPEQLMALRRNAFTSFGANLLAQQGQPGSTPFMGQIGRAALATDWPGMVERAGRSALELGQMQQKMESEGAVREVMTRHMPQPGPDGVISPQAQMRAFRNIYNDLLQIGTPEAMQAADQVAKGHALYKEVVPSAHSIQWLPVTQTGADGKPQQLRQAMNPMTGKPILDEDGKPIVLPADQIPSPMSEADAAKFEDSINQHFLTHILKYSDMEGQFKSFLATPLPTEPQAKALWVKRAQTLAGAASAAAAEDPSMAALAGALSLVNDKLGRALAKGDVSTADMQEMLKAVRLAYDQNRRSGYNIFRSYDVQARNRGYVSPMIEQYRSEWGGLGGGSVAAPQPVGDASKVDAILRRNRGQP